MGTGRGTVRKRFAGFVRVRPTGTGYFAKINFGKSTGTEGF